MKHARRVLVVLLVVGSFLLGGVATASAQSTDIDASQFTDPVTGELDLDAYLAAVAAANRAAGGQQAAAGGTLPATGSSSADVAAVGLALLVIGGVALGFSIRGRRLSRSSA